MQLSVTSPSGLVSSSRPLHVLIDASPPVGALRLHGCTPGSTLWRRVLPVRPPPTVPVPTAHLESSHVMCGLGCPGLYKTLYSERANIATLGRTGSSVRDGVSYQNDLGQIAVCWSGGLRDADSGLARLEWRLWKELGGTWAYVQQGHLVVGDPRLTTALNASILTLYSAEPPVKSGSSVSGTTRQPGRFRHLGPGLLFTLRASVPRKLPVRAFVANV